MRIAITSITYEGLIRCNREFFEILKSLGHEVYIVSPSKTNTYEAIRNGYHYCPIIIEPHGKNPLREYGLYKQYKTVYGIIKPDLVISMTIKPDVYSGLACGKLKIPYFAVVNGVGDAIYNGGLLAWVVLTLLKFGLRRSKWVFFQNHVNRDYFIQKKIVKECNSSLVPGSGINLEDHPYEEYPEEADTIVFTYIGRLSKDKGIRELLEATKILKNEYGNICFNLVGSCSDEYKEKVLEANNDKYVNYLGNVPSGEIHSIIKDSHAIVLPSYHEGVPNVLLEAGAAGRPIIATFTEGCEDTFDDGISGIGFEIKSTRALVNAIEKFLSMTMEERKLMGIEANKKISKEFDRNIVNREYMTLISKLEEKKRHWRKRNGLSKC